MIRLTHILFLLWLAPLTLSAQQPDITGVWNGELQMTDTAGNPVKLPYEIAVSEEKGKFTGYSRIVFHANGKEEPGIQNIELKWKGKEIVMEDEGFIEHQFSINPSRRVKKTMIVTLRETDREMIMEGTWSTNRTRYYIPAKGTVVLRRKLDFKKSEIFKSLDTLKLVTKLSFKDRPELPPVTAMAPPPPQPEPAPEPDLVIPVLAIMKAERTESPVPAKAAAARVTAMPARKKAQFDALAHVPMKPAPAPVVTAAVAPPVKKDPPPPPPEKKPAPQPKPVAAAPPVKAAEPPPVAVQPPPPPEKKPAPRPEPPPLELAAPSLVKGAAEIDKRVTRTDQSFYFQSDSLMLTLYDNGEVDGDTVTVLMNGNVLFSKAGLDIKPNTKTIYITRNMDSVKLVMYAESLGEIPPNTGLLIVNDGDKRYEVRFSADLKTNAAIVLRRKKEE